MQNFNLCSFIKDHIDFKREVYLEGYNIRPLYEMPKKTKETHIGYMQRKFPMDEDGSMKYVYTQGKIVRYNEARFVFHGKVKEIEIKEG